MSTFTVKLTLCNQQYDIEYVGIDECLADIGLKGILDGRTAKCSLWTGSLRITARDITTWDQLVSQLISNGSTLLRHYAKEAS